MFAELDYSPNASLERTRFVKQRKRRDAVNRLARLSRRHFKLKSHFDVSQRQVCRSNGGELEKVEDECAASK